MKLGNLMLIKSIVCLFFAVGFLVVPMPLLSLFGIGVGPGAVLMSRFFGAAFVVLGLLLLLGRNDPGSEALRAIVLAVFIGDIIGFIVALLGQLSGMMNTLGWLVVALWLVLALGFGYFQLLKPGASRTTSSLPQKP